MRVGTSDITAAKDPTYHLPSAVRLDIINNEFGKTSNRGSGMYFRSTEEVLAAIKVLRACLPVVDQLADLADGA